VCVRVQQNILNTENKRDKIFVNEVETLWREKPLWGNQTQDIHYTEDKASYKTLVLTYPWYNSHIFNSDTKTIVNAFQPSLLLEWVFNGILYLRADP
jgi:HSP90 family molecular chaperone